MSVFASRTSKTIPIPFDPPQTVTIQRLPGRHLEASKQAFLAALYAGVQSRGGAVVQKEMEALWKPGAGQTAAAEDVAAVIADPLNGYDPATLVLHGVKAWSYDVACGPAAFDDLDDEAVEFFAREVLRLTKPALFQSVDDVTAALKNG